MDVRVCAQELEEGAGPGLLRASDHEVRYRHCRIVSIACSRTAEGVADPKVVAVATDDLCTHGNASLADGMIDGDAIECPLHLGTFDIRTGAPGAAPCTVALRTYKLREEAGTLLMEIA